MILFNKLIDYIKTKRIQYKARKEFYTENKVKLYSQHTKMAYGQVLEARFKSRLAHRTGNFRWAFRAKNLWTSGLSISHSLFKSWLL